MPNIAPNASQVKSSAVPDPSIIHPDTPFQAGKGTEPSLPWATRRLQEAMWVTTRVHAGVISYNHNFVQGPFRSDAAVTAGSKSAGRRVEA